MSLSLEEGRRGEEGWVWGMEGGVRVGRMEGRVRVGRM